MRSDKLPEALAELSSAVQMNASLAEAHYHVGMAHQLAQSPANAKAAFEKAIELGTPRNPIWLEDAKARLNALSGA